MIIYIAENILNGKKYVGQTTCSLNKRIKEHIDKNKMNTYFHKAIHKYGPENFKWRILGTCNSKQELNEAEITCIEFFQSNDKRYGYNMTGGGDGSVGHKPSIQTRLKMSKSHSNISMETRQKISNAMKGRPSWNKGKHISETTKEKISKAFSGDKHPMYGKKHSIEAIEKMRKAKIGKVPWNKGKTGIYSEETKKKMSEAKRKT